MSSIQEVEAAAQAVRDAERRLRETVAAARTAGVPGAALARAAGVSRPTINSWIRQTS